MRAILCASYPSIVVTSGNKKPGASWASGFPWQERRCPLPSVSRGGNPAAVALLDHVQDRGAGEGAFADMRPLGGARAISRSPAVGAMSPKSNRHVVMLLSFAKTARRRRRAQWEMPALEGWRDNQEGTAGAFRLFRQPTGGIVFRPARLVGVDHPRNDRESDSETTFERNGVPIGAVRRGGALTVAQDRLHRSLGEPASPRESEWLR